MLWQRITSNERVRNKFANWVASPCCSTTLSVTPASRAARFAISSIAGEESSSVTCMPRRAKRIAVTPVPQPTSSAHNDFLDCDWGRKSSRLANANLEDFLPQSQSKKSLCALDVGCGTGVTAIRLARLGMHVTLLDSSPAMLDIAKRAAREAGVTDKVVLQNGGATEWASLPQTQSFDVILCHNILEYCDDPGAVLCAAARALRDSSAILSVLARNQAGEVFKAAIQAGDLAAAKNGLTAEWGQEALYGGRVRLFTPDSLRSMLTEASLATIAVRGVRVLADYLPS